MLIGASTADVVIAGFSAVSAVVIAGISAWAAINVARATSTAAAKDAKLAELEHDNAELARRVKQLERGTRR